MTATAHLFPKLRPLDIHPIVQNGRRSLLLRDPLRLSPETVVVPQPLHLALSLCDGTREDAGALSASLAIRHGIRIPAPAIDQLLSALDRTYLLDNDACVQAQARALSEYRAAPFRPPASAGQSYPAQAQDLRRLLDTYLAQADAVHPGDAWATLRRTSKRQASHDVGAGGIPPHLPIRGLITPHIDYARGGPVYAQVWQQARDAVREADLVLILGTDHYGSAGAITLTRQHYATPYGVLPTARAVADALIAALGEQAALAEELHHRTEHSIELATIWLHHMRGGEPCDTVPVLCGSFQHYIQGQANAAQAPEIGALVDAFRRAAQGRRVLVVAAADLAHAGPAFGGRPLDMFGRARLQAADDALIERIVAGDAEGLLAEIQQVEDRNNVCGVPPIYLALRLLQGDACLSLRQASPDVGAGIIPPHSAIRGDLVAYDRCLADAQGTSLVSICGIVLS